MNPDQRDLHHNPENEEWYEHEEDLACFIELWNSYTGLYKRIHALNNGSSLKFYQTKREIEDLQSNLDDTAEKMVEEFSDFFNFTGFGLEKKDNSDELCLVIDSASGFKQWVSKIKERRSLRVGFSNEVIDLVDTILDNFNRPNEKKSEDFYVLYSVIDDLIDLTKCIEQKSSVGFHENQLQELEDIRRASEHKYTSEYMQMVRIGLLDVYVEEQNNFPWAKDSPSDFQDKAEALKEGIDSLYFQILTGDSEDFEAMIFFKDVLLRLSEKLKVLLKVPDSTKHSDVRYLLYSDLGMLVDKIIGQLSV